MSTVRFEGLAHLYGHELGSRVPAAHPRRIYADDTQVRPARDRPLLTVRDRQGLILRHAEGPAGEYEPGSGVA